MASTEAHPASHPDLATLRAAFHAPRYPPRTNAAGQRYCTGCMDYLDPSAFGRDVTRRDGLHVYCRACRNYMGRIDYRRNREARRAAATAYRVAHPEKMREYQRTKTARRKAREQARLTQAQEA